MRREHKSHEGKLYAAVFAGFPATAGGAIGIAVTMPLAGALLWKSRGYQWAFLIGAAALSPAGKLSHLARLVRRQDRYP